MGALASVFTGRVARGKTRAMRVHRGFQHVPAAARRCSVAIGNFDGLHAGHRAVLQTASEHARDLGTQLGVISFEPHPREVITPERAPARLSPLRRKVELLRDAGVEHLFLLPFNRALMAVSAEQFIEIVLVGAFDVSAVCTGSDFRFGQKRRGDTDMLSAAGERYGFRASIVQRIDVAGDICSSTRIRSALQQGDVTLAAELLGYSYAIDGVVRTGDQRGRGLGFPTANVYPLSRRAAFPATGVYTVRAGIMRHGAIEWHPAVANLGTNPTFDGRELRLEVHLLDGIDHQLYGRRLRVTFLERLRNEERFDSVDAMIAQMHRDCDRARKTHRLATN